MCGVSVLHAQGPARGADMTLGGPGARRWAQTLCSEGSSGCGEDDGDSSAPIGLGGLGDEAGMARGQRSNSAHTFCSPYHNPLSEGPALWTTTWAAGPLIVQPLLSGGVGVMAAWWICVGGLMDL
ncbi:unnamed protein product [Lota lota]